MLARARQFLSCDSGAATVDWVVLTAALVGLGLTITFTLWDSMTTNSGSLLRQMEAHTIDTTFD